MKYIDEKEFDKINVFGKGEPNKEYAKFFVGRSFLKLLSLAGEPDIFTANVTFEPGCRNNWHIHHAVKGGGQLLICTAGEGWYQEEGKDPVEMKPGVVITIPTGVKHWHGAKRDSWFSHIAQNIPGEDCSNEWLEPVTDYTYKRLEDYEDKISQIVQTAGRNALGDFAPAFAHFNDDILFGENWNNKDIDVKTRCIITIVSLMSQGITDSSLKYHLQNAKDNGVTKSEIAAIVTHVAFYAGWPKAWAVFNLAKEIWD